MYIHGWMQVVVARKMFRVQKQIPGKGAGTKW
jgi:hypothetical protein